MALIEAALERDIDELRKILDERPDAFTTDINEDDQDALQFICAQREIDNKKAAEYEEMIRILLDHAKENGLNINAVDMNDNGQTALMYAMENNHPGFVDVFLKDEYKALIDAEVLAGGRTHLIVAARHNFLNVAKAVVGQDIDRKDSSQKRTALHWAGYCGHKELALFLLQNGANRDALDRDGKTPMQLAKSNGKETTAEVISSFQITKEERKNDTPAKRPGS